MDQWKRDELVINYGFFGKYTAKRWFNAWSCKNLVKSRSSKLVFKFCDNWALSIETSMDRPIDVRQGIYVAPGKVGKK